jgi:hypothetical protein
VFKRFPLFSVIVLSTVLVMLPCACPVLSMWFEYTELLLLFLIACVFFISSEKISTCLPYVFLWAAHAFHLVNAFFSYLSIYE